MKLLAIETALETASVALWEGEGEPAADSISETACGERALASRDLLPAIDRLLRARTWSMAMLDGVILSIGPGSFTGLRIGVSLVKGLAAARRIRVAPVGTLDAVAIASGRSGLVAAVLDARRGEVYARLFRCDAGRAEPLGDEVLAAPEAWAASLPAEGALWCVGGGAVRYGDVLGAVLGSRATLVAELETTVAAAALRLGYRELVAGAHTPVEQLLPRYLRRPTAETNLERGVVGSRRRRVLGWDPAHGRA